MSKFCLYLTLAIVLAFFTANNHAIDSIEIIVNDHGEDVKEPAGEPAPRMPSARRAKLNSGARWWRPPPIYYPPPPPAAPPPPPEYEIQHDDYQFGRRMEVYQGDYYY